MPGSKIESSFAGLTAGHYLSCVGNARKCSMGRVNENRTWPNCPSSDKSNSSLHHKCFSPRISSFYNTYSFRETEVPKYFSSHSSHFTLYNPTIFVNEINFSIAIHKDYLIPNRKTYDQYIAKFWNYDNIYYVYTIVYISILSYPTCMWVLFL